MPLTFDDNNVVYDGNIDAVRFYAEADGKRVPCAVSHEALTDAERSQEGDPDVLIAFYFRHADRIKQIAQRLYGAGMLTNGIVLVRTKDLNPQG